MNLSDEQITELTRLCDALFDGNIEDADRAKLDRWISESPAACRFYLEQADLSSALHLHAAEEDNRFEPDIAIVRSGPSYPNLLLLAASVVLLLGLGGLWHWYDGRTSQQLALVDEERYSAFRPASADRPIAVLVEANEAVWENQALNAAKVVPLRSGWLELNAGTAQIRFNSGAMVTLTSPARFRLIGEKQSYLERGDLVASVPKEAIGFKVDTPDLKVVDLGTEFRVRVRPVGETDVFVVKGLVEVAGPRERIQLRTNQGRRFSKHGKAVAIGGASVAPAHPVKGVDARQRLGIYTFDTTGSGAANDPFVTDASARLIGRGDVRFHDFLYRGVEPGPFRYQENLNRWSFKDWRPDYQRENFYVGFKVEANDGGRMKLNRLALQVSRAGGGQDSVLAPRDGVLLVSTNGFANSKQYTLISDYRESYTPRHLNIDLSELAPAPAYEFRLLFKGESRARAIRLDEVMLDLDVQF